MAPIDQHRPSSEEKKKSQHRLILITGCAFFVGIIFMMSVNRAELLIIVGQFAALWSIEQNRLEIIRLGFKIFLSGVVFAALGLAGHRVLYALQQYQQEETEESAPPPPASLRPALPSPPAMSLDARRQVLQTGIQERYRVPLQATPRPEERRAAPPIRQATTFLPGKAAQPVQKASQVQIMPGTEKAQQVATEGAQEPLPQPREPGTALGLVVGDTILVKEKHLDRELEQQVQSKQAQAPQADPDETKEPILITLTLLKTVTMTLHAPDGSKTYPVTLDDLAPKAVQLIAYIAWKMGRKVNLGDMRDEVFGSDDMDLNQVQEALNTAKREIRARIRQAVERAREDQGKDVFPPDLDIFALQKKKYWLPAYAQVTDLAEIEKQHQIIDLAENRNLLINTVPEDVYAACKALIKAYTGDFLEELLKSNIYAFDPPMDSWAREPFTLFRDYYLQAVLYAAEYERKKGDASRVPAEQREHYAEAGRLFNDGAIKACKLGVCDGMFDTKVFFKSGRRHGAHVLLSEQLIRRAIALYGAIGATIMVRKIYATYEQQMADISGKAWTADPETVKDLEAALQQTGGYRFPDTIASPADLSSETGLVGSETA